MIHTSTRFACSAVSDGGNSNECTGFTRWTDWTNQKAVSLGYGGGFLAHANVAKILRKKMLALCHDNRSSLSLLPRCPCIPLLSSRCPHPLRPFFLPVAFIIIAVSTFISIASAAFVATMPAMEELGAKSLWDRRDGESNPL